MQKEERGVKAYVVDSVYDSVAKADQTPILLSYVAAAANFKPPNPGDSFSYLELGCSSGATLNLLAAAYPQSRFYGVDINQTAIEKAQQDAEEASLPNISYSAAAFSDLKPAEMGNFDYIVCQGTYSWLSPIEKSALVRIVDACISSGGLFLVHYVTQSNSSVTTMWHFLRQLVPFDGADSVDRLQSGLELFAELRDAGAVFLNNHPQALGVLNEIEARYQAGDDLTNIAHNVFSEHFSPTSFNEMSDAMDAVGFAYCGDSQNLLLNDPDLCIPGSVRKRFEEMGSRVQQEMFKDFCLPDFGRSDVFIRKQARKPAVAQRYLHESLGAVLIKPQASILKSIADDKKKTFYNFDNPVMRFVLERISRDDINLVNISSRSNYGTAELEDAFTKLVVWPGVELCLAEKISTQPENAKSVSPASQYNLVTLKTSIRTAQDVLLSAPALGGWISLAPAGAMIALDACQNGLDAPDSQVYERLTKLLNERPGLAKSPLPDVFSSQEAFARFRQWFLGNRLPLLVRVGALECGVA